MSESNVSVLTAWNAAMRQICRALDSVERGENLGPTGPHCWRPCVSTEAVLAIDTDDWSARLLYSGQVRITAGDATREELAQLLRYAELCEAAVDAVPGIFVDPRDLDEALQNTTPAFKKTAAFRRLDDSLA